MTKRINTATYAGHAWNLGGEIALTRAQKHFLDELVKFRYSGVHTGAHLPEEKPWTTTQFRRLATFVALNSKLIEELPRTARGGWGYRLRSEVKP